MVNIEDTGLGLNKLLEEYAIALAQSVYLKATCNLENDPDRYKRYVGLRQKLFSLENKMVWAIKQSRE